MVEHTEFGICILKLVEGEDTRVQREIEIVTQSEFSNVPKVLLVDNYEAGEEKGFYIFEEYIKGTGLREILRQEKLPLDEAIRLAEDILKIIVQMQEQYVVHRDIKPENIIRSLNGEWYLIDFGIARALKLNSLTLTAVQVGPHTPGYGAPELFQYQKKDIDSRADIFSLGVVLFEAVTGKHPFIRGDEMNLNEVWYNTITVIPQSVVISGDKDMQFMGLIQTFMQKHITRRPRDAQKALEWLLSVKQSIAEGSE